MKNIKEVAGYLGVGTSDLYIYGESLAKIKAKDNTGKSKYILVTATNPTKYGEGKTTVAIGLHDAFKSLGVSSVLTLREPSMGPVFGLKGGATGGAKSLIVPEVPINLHFTGDFHAITSANNLICAMIDNEIFQGNALDIKKVVFHRTMDMNDRALRKVTLHNGKDVREESFTITAASEIMAIFCLSKDMDDLRRRIDKIIIGYNSNNEEIYVSDLGITDAVLSLLKDAMNPNLVQTNNENPVLVHGGPFANIAHGCNSLIALNTASNYGDYIITEAGFGADAGAFKFMDIVGRENNISPYAIVLVTSIRALKHNGDGSLSDGIENLRVHVDNLELMNKNIIVALNKFSDDTLEDINYIEYFCRNRNILFSITDSFNEGSNSLVDLANKIMSFKDCETNYLYDLEDTLEDKINAYVKNISHASKFIASEEVMNKINYLSKYKYPICVAKTQYSISGDENLLGYPKDYVIEIKDVEVANGAEFIKVYFGNILTMPGLNKTPSAKKIKFINERIILPR